MFLNLLKKELREILTISSIVLIAAMSLMYALIGQSIGNIEEEITKKPSIGIVNLDSGRFGLLVTDILKQISTVLYTGTNIDEAIKTVAESGTALLTIPEDFTEKISSGVQTDIEVYWMLKGLGIMDSVSSGVIQNLIYYMRNEISKTLMKENGFEHTDFVLNPVIRNDVTFLKGKELGNVSPNQLLDTIFPQSMMTSVIIMMLIMTAGGSVISSMGLEKENKTLETLLTMPVRRSEIVFSKILAAAIAGLIMAAIYMVGFSFYMGSFSMSSGGAVIETIKLTVNDYFLVGILIFTSLLCGISISMLLGIFSKDYKSAQTMNFPLIALAVFSMLVTLFKDFSTLPLALKIVTFAIPFTHPMLAIRNLMVQDHGIILWSILYTSSFAIVMIAVVSWFFNSDRLIIGRVKTRRR
ncbi:MAG: ABC transporter permease [Thermotogaceae bacterium]|nr:ABC transporter permease [Thermotogaceae bacterium]